LKVEGGRWKDKGAGPRLKAQDEKGRSWEDKGAGPRLKAQGEKGRRWEDKGAGARLKAHARRRVKKVEGGKYKGAKMRRCEGNEFGMRKVEIMAIKLRSLMLTTV
jgi:hypothetical protein